MKSHQRHCVALEVMAMSEEELRNWKKVKEALAAKGLTETYYYKRAVAILKTGVDPLDTP